MSSNDENWWNDPCHLKSTSEISNIVDVKTLDLTKIIRSVRFVLMKANYFKANWARLTFSLQFDQLYLWKSYPWLPQLPKKYNERIDEKYYKDLSAQDVLRDLYHYFQHYAAGVHQAYLEYNQEENSDLTFRVLNEALMPLGCELHNLLIEQLYVPLSQNVTIDVIPDNLKAPFVKTERSMRDFIIYKELINFLEYCDQTLTYYNERAK